MSKIQTQLNTLLKLTDQIIGPSESREIQAQVKRMGRIGTVQKQANLSVIKDLGPKIVYNLSTAIEDDLPDDVQSLQKMATMVKQLYDFFPPGSIGQTYFNDLSDARKAIENKMSQVQLNKVENNMQANVINNLVNASGDNPIALVVDTADNLKLPSVSTGGIQDQLQKLIPILDSAPSTGIVGQSQLPTTMALLSQYSQTIGFKGTGSIQGRRSKVYVGVDQQMVNGEMVNKPFPGPGSLALTNPSIQQSFRNYAGKTIVAWNNYVQAQEEFIDFANKVNSKDKRQEYIKNQIKEMNGQTFAAQGLSTLVYYYIYGPMRYIISKFKNQTAVPQFTKEYFLDNYEFPMGTSWNPFAMSYQSIVKLINILFSNQGAQDKVDAVGLYQTISTEIKGKALLPQGTKNMQTWSQYATNKINRSKAYLRSLGISQANAQKILDRDQIVNLKTARITIPNQYTNSQLLQIVNDTLALDSEMKNDYEEGYWYLTWGMQSLPAYDYIWEKTI